MALICRGVPADQRFFARQNKPTLRLEELFSSRATFPCGLESAPLGPQGPYLDLTSLGLFTQLHGARQSLSSNRVYYWA